VRENSIFNKKGFTLLELLIAFSIFGIISVMTFSIINYVPKLAKTESSQYSERTYVRRALTEITATIQSASAVATPPLVFTIPNGEKISYEYSAGNVNKLVDGTPHRLMESVAEFSITPTESNLFNIHIKTSKEGKNYDFKVDRRRGGNIRTNAEISSIAPVTAIFDKNILLQQDISITLNLNGNDLNRLMNNLNILNSTTDYSISGDVLTLNKEYLKAQPNGMITIIFDVSNGADPELSVEIINTSTDQKIEGNSYEDDLIRVNYPGNLGIDPNDNSWMITVTNGTVIDEFNASHLEITGLPLGIDVTAIKVEGENKILITLSGTASAPVTTTDTIEIVLMRSAVSEAASDSNPIKVFLLPWDSFGSPEHNMLFTNELEIVSKTDITGDIVIGRGNTTTTINHNANIIGNVYVDSSLTINSNFNVGTDEKNAKVFVKGSVLNQSNTKIKGDLFYRDTLTNNSQLKVDGIIQQRAVEIPEAIIPKPRDEQWYRSNGYTIVDNSWTSVILEDNGKYYFKDNYWFNSNNKDVDNITIVGMKDITINSTFSGSGILFTPYGKITVNSTFDFEGMLVSQSTILAGNTDLFFTRYPVLPFD
jgi:prepilin-type N-terminal cleavage/methylation domain-containing protein